jgi:periplasmic divalent cation tolerance protein
MTLADPVSDQGDYLMVLCTCPDPATAATVAQRAVEAGTAACAGRVDEVRSVFRWEGAVQEEDEALLLLKTRRDHFDRLAELIREVHPYDVPEIIAVPIILGDAQYLSWIDDNLHRPEGS